MGGLFTKRTHEVPANYHSILSQYEGHCDWLRDTNFLRDLESDSVDSDILDEELRSLELHEEKTCRRRTAKVLESSPLQIAMCVLVILDAAIVLSEILIDLHAMRSQSVAATSDLALALDFIEQRFADELAGFDRYQHSVQDILDHLDVSDGDRRQQAAAGRQRRGVPDCFASSEDRVRFCRRLQTTACDRAQRRSRHQHVSVVRSVPLHDLLTAGKDGNELQRPWRRHTATTTTIRCDADEETDSVAVETHPDDSSRSSTSLKSVIRSHVSEHRRRRPKIAERKRKRSATGDSVTALSVTSSIPATKSHDVSRSSKHHYRRYYEKKVKHLLKAAHILHYCSIAILGIFVVQVFTRLFALGTEFFTEKLEIFDAIIVMASFVLDVVFLDGVTEVSEGDQAAALIMTFLLWRVLRIVNGLMVTSKKRQEFRIKLQKRARQRLEKRMETFREDYDLLQKETANLKALCTNKGVSDEELAMCKPRRRTVVQMTTMTGLSSIASLSLGLSMTMSSGAEPTTAKDRAAKLQSQLSMIAAPPPPSKPPRRASLDPPSYHSAVLPPSTPSLADTPQRPSIRRQPAVCPSPISEQPPTTNEGRSSDEQLAAGDGHVTVVSF